MSLPIRLYYPITKAADLLECEFDDLIHHAAQERLELCVKLSSDHPFYDENDVVISWSVASSFAIDMIKGDNEVYQQGQMLAQEIFAKEWQALPERQPHLVAAVHRSKYFQFAELYDLEKQVSVTQHFSGLFSINLDFIKLNEIKIINHDIQHVYVNMLKLPRCDAELTDFYQLKSIQLETPMFVSVKELLISNDEADLLRKGGKRIQPLSFRMRPI